MTHLVNFVQRLGVAGIGLFCVLGLATPQAKAQHMPRMGEKLWGAYISAAEFATEKRDFDSAQVALEAALDLAKTGGPQEPRVAMTHLFLFLNAYDRKDDTSANKYKAAIQEGAPLKPETFDNELLTAADTFYILAANRYNVWKETKSDDPLRFLPLKEAEFFAAMAYRIRKKLSTDNAQLANAGSYYGLVLSKESGLPDHAKQIEELYEEAVRNYVERETQELERQRYTQSFSLMRPEENDSKPEVKETAHLASGHHISDDALSMRILMGQQYYWLGESYTDTLNPKDATKEKELDAAKKRQVADAATVAYQKAEKNFRDALAVYKSEWPEHIQVASTEWWLADVYESQGRTDDAIAALQSALPAYENNYGHANRNVKQIAEQLANLLDKANQNDQAKHLRETYDIPKPAAKSSKPN